MRDKSVNVGRRALIKGAALVALASRVQAQGQAPAAEVVTRVVDVPLNASNTVSVERRDDVVLVGLNRPFIQNRIDPPTRGGVMVAVTLGTLIM